MARGWWLRRERERTATGGWVYWSVLRAMAGWWQAGAPALTLARESSSAIECDDMTIVDGFGSTCDVVARYNATLGDTRS